MVSEEQTGYSPLRRLSGRAGGTGGAFASGNGMTCPPSNRPWRAAGPANPSGPRRPLADALAAGQRVAQVSRKGVLWFVTGLLIGLPATQGANAENQAITADVATTGIGIIGYGAAELNPLALPLIPVRYHLDRKYSGKCTDFERWSNTFSYAAATNNLLVIAGAGALAPLGLLLAVPLQAYYKRQQINCKVAVLRRVFAMEVETVFVNSTAQ